MAGKRVRRDALTARISDQEAAYLARREERAAAPRTCPEAAGMARLAPEREGISRTTEQPTDCQNPQYPQVNEAATPAGLDVEPIHQLVKNGPKPLSAPIQVNYASGRKRFRSP